MWRRATLGTAPRAEERTKAAERRGNPNAPPRRRRLEVDPSDPNCANHPCFEETKIYPGQAPARGAPARGPVLARAPAGAGKSSQPHTRTGVQHVAAGGAQQLSSARWPFALCAAACAAGLQPQSLRTTRLPVHFREHTSQPGDHRSSQHGIVAVSGVFAEDDACRFRGRDLQRDRYGAQAAGGRFRWAHHCAMGHHVLLPPDSISNPATEWNGARFCRKSRGGL